MLNVDPKKGLDNRLDIVNSHRVCYFYPRESEKSDYYFVYHRL